MSFTPGILVTSDKLKLVNKNQDSLQFENAMYRVLYERSNITALFEEHLEFLEQMAFANAVWVSIENQ